MQGEQEEKKSKPLLLVLASQAKRSQVGSQAKWVGTLCTGYGSAHDSIWWQGQVSHYVTAAIKMVWMVMTVFLLPSTKLCLSCAVKPLGTLLLPKVHSCKARPQT